jgi:hypothetical protein
MKRWGSWYWRRVHVARRHRESEVAADAAEVEALRAQVELLESAIRAHMTDHDAERPWQTPRRYDRGLWRTVTVDGLTDEERRYGGC